MEENLKLDLNKLEGKDGKLILEIRENEEPIKKWYDKAVQINGTISSAGNFYDERKVQMKDVIKKSHILFSYRDLFLKLTMIENHDINYVVNGKLIENPELKKLQVNTQAKLDTKQLVDLLKFNRAHFADKEQCNAIMQELLTTKVQITTDLEKMLNNGTGNERAVYDRVVKGVKPMNFNLLLPVFIGQQASKFEVTINIEARDKDVTFWLESIELEEIKMENAKAIIDAELSRFDKSGLVIIEQ